MKQGIRKVALMILFSFVFLSTGLVYWQVVRADTLLEHPANRRAILLEDRITRGGIYDRNGVALAVTKVEEGLRTRVYPQGEMFQPLLGYASLQYGSAGMEASQAESLLGLKEPTISRQLQNAFELERDGSDLILTLDLALQKAAYDGMKGKVGAAVAIDPRDGDVLALVSQPSYDANQLEENWDQILTQAGSPLLNHAFSQFPPGSVMKVITSAALFEANLDTTELYHCQGSTVINGQTITEQNDRAHGWVNYDLALAYSCNTYFAEKGIEAGTKSFLHAVSAFGFGQPIPFDLYVPISSVTNSDPLPATLNTNLFAASSFGQGQVMISPFHLALITAGVANEGKIMSPHLIDSVLDSNQNSIYKRKAEIWLEPLTKEEAQKVKSGMILAVNQGTAVPGGIKGVQIAAKTGSAEPGGDNKTHAWYIAFAPAEDPEIAVAVLVENGGTGGEAAAPIAKAIIEKALNQKEGVIQ